MKLVKRERPDYLLFLPGVKVGIEHVEAVSENQAAIDALRNNSAIANTALTRHSTPGEKKKKYQALIKKVGHDGGHAWVGNASEVEWADALIPFKIIGY